MTSPENCPRLEHLKQTKIKNKNKQQQQAPCCCARSAQPGCYRRDHAITREAELVRYRIPGIATGGLQSLQGAKRQQVTAPKYRNPWALHSTFLVFSVLLVSRRTTQARIIRRCIKLAALCACPRSVRESKLNPKKGQPSPRPAATARLAHGYKVSVSRQTAGAAFRAPSRVHHPHWHSLQLSNHRNKGLRLHHRQRQHPYLFSSRKKPLQQQMNTRCDILLSTAQG